MSFLPPARCWLQGVSVLDFSPAAGKGASAGFETVRHIEQRIVWWRKHHNQDLTSNPARCTAGAIPQGEGNAPQWAFLLVFGTASLWQPPQSRRRQRRVQSDQRVSSRVDA